MEKKEFTSRNGKKYRVSENGWRYTPYSELSDEQKQRHSAACKAYQKRLRETPEGRLKLAETYAKSALKKLEKLRKQAENTDSNDTAPEN